jgi:hypothetical protein
VEVFIAQDLHHEEWGSCQSAGPQILADLDSTSEGTIPEMKDRCRSVQTHDAIHIVVLHRLDPSLSNSYRTTGEGLSRHFDLTVLGFHH